MCMYVYMYVFIHSSGYNKDHQQVNLLSLFICREWRLLFEVQSSRLKKSQFKEKRKEGIVVVSGLPHYLLNCSLETL